MGILTNFLKLLKPEPNDFVDVTKHISENYDKLDKAAETNNQALTNLNNNKLDKGTYNGKADDLDKAKLDKGTYPGTASDIKTEIDGKVSKAGDDVTGNLTMSGQAPIEINTTYFSGAWRRGIQYLRSGQVIGNIGAFGTGSGLEYLFLSSGNDEIMVKNGDSIIKSNRLQSINKEAIAAINETYSKLSGNAGLEFDSNLMYIQDIGTKQAGKYYFDKNTLGLFRCKTTTNTTVNDTNFVNESNYATAYKIDNYCELGSSGNNYYAKYADGRLECWGFFEAAKGGTGYVVLPHAFAMINEYNSYTVNIGILQNTTGVVIPSVTAGNLRFQAFDYQNRYTESSLYCSYTCKGRWKL
ncbi:hypothetical protein [uncultured Fusobacterium sp.]|jgi:hypothetical protein|uniref:hypothetical protein n=1 Tax=uncultured Fusobacterium sp. TaxID=159267 RepID=UPI0027DC932F|nr:hypothetical protein [uncultured Fusobacterium sp.]